MKIILNPTHLEYKNSITQIEVSYNKETDKIVLSDTLLDLDEHKHTTLNIVEISPEQFFKDLKVSLGITRQVYSGGIVVWGDKSVQIPGGISGAITRLNAEYLKSKLKIKTN